jgi:ferritin
MVSDTILNVINEQITKELYSSYLYLQMAAWFEHKTLPGFASWMKVQAQEEIAHAMILYNYLNERGGMVTLGDIKMPPAEYTSPLNILEKTVEHEKSITAAINDCVDLAIKEKDHATKNRLDWFVTEQVEEESSPSALVEQLKIIKDDGAAMFMLDRELSARVFITPTPLAGE